MLLEKIHSADLVSAVLSVTGNLQTAIATEQHTYIFEETVAELIRLLLLAWHSLVSCLGEVSTFELRFCTSLQVRRFGSTANERINGE